MPEIETLLTRIWNPSSRSLAEEAWRCYNAGAMRASIAAIWTATTSDLIAKIGFLADDGEPRAKEVRGEVDQAQQHGLSPDGVRAMQRIEASLLPTALELEMIDAIDQRALERIREDRNLCVHPSLRPFSETYSPPREVARAHIAVALETLLVHRPTQGRKVVQSYLDFTCARSFAPAINHIQSTYFDRVRAASRRSIVDIAAKHALLELDPNGRLDAKQYANRSAVVLSAFALKDRGLIRDVVVGLRDRFRHVNPEKQRRALARLGHEDFFWEMADEALTEMLNELVKDQIPSGTSMGEVEAKVISMVALDSVRTRLPALVDQFEGLPPYQQADVVDARPHPYFAPTLAKLLQSAGSYRMGDRVGQIIVKMAPLLTLGDLAATLDAWSANDQCRQASSMPDVAENLYHSTVHLGRPRDALFQSFLKQVRGKTDDDDVYYKYPALEAALAGTGTG